ncbi:hypothetical protein FNV43_RR25499 [Rhamnella rubrinervis]|uniref:Uncharacterized protein n=1 Tax=Rhamnella rubrinervis TaxID=2594499 RepID=A0A8K0GR69_9ROSA|nr:hypothetical protein FNV43_RR25499 [Rhamnella rubrinervis]
MAPKRLRKANDKSTKQQQESPPPRRGAVRLRNPLMHSRILLGQIYRGISQVGRGVSSCYMDIYEASAKWRGALSIYGYPRQRGHRQVGGNARFYTDTLGQIGHRKFSRGVSVYDKRAPIGQFGRCLGKFGRGVSVYNKRAPSAKLADASINLAEEYPVYNKRHPSANLVDDSAHLTEGYPVYNKRHPSANLANASAQLVEGYPVYNKRHPSTNLADASANLAEVSRRIISEGAGDIAHLIVIFNLQVALKVIYNKLQKGIDQFEASIFGDFTRMKTR